MSVAGVGVGGGDANGFNGDDEAIDGGAADFFAPAAAAAAEAPARGAAVSAAAGANGFIGVVAAAAALAAAEGAPSHAEPLFRRVNPAKGFATTVAASAREVFRPAVDAKLGDAVADAGSSRAAAAGGILA